MSLTFNKTTIVASAILALMVLASGASAAPSLGFPSGRPYYGAPNQHSGSRSGAMRSYSRARSGETRQSFSYEPAESGPATVTHGSCGCGGHHQAAKSSDSGSAVAKAPQVERRSYSYEPSAQPAPRARSYNRSAAPKKDPWMYPKSDPRRYSH